MLALIANRPDPTPPDMPDVPRKQPPELEPLRRTAPEIDPAQTPEVPATPPRRQTPPAEVPVQG